MCKSQSIIYSLKIDGVQLLWYNLYNKIKAFSNGVLIISEDQFK